MLLKRSKYILLLNNAQLKAWINRLKTYIGNGNKLWFVQENMYSCEANYIMIWWTLWYSEFNSEALQALFYHHFHWFYDVWVYFLQWRFHIYFMKCIHKIKRNITTTTTKPNTHTTNEFFLSSWVSFRPVFLVLSGHTLLSSTPIITSRAPFQDPGPTNLYWAGKHGPKKHLKASFGSVMRRCHRFGLAPIKDEISSKYSMKFTCEKIQIWQSELYFVCRCQKDMTLWKFSNLCHAPSIHYKMITRWRHVCIADLSLI